MFELVYEEINVFHTGTYMECLRKLVSFSSRKGFVVARTGSSLIWSY
jgi:hypothetical protein